MSISTAWPALAAGGDWEPPRAPKETDAALGKLPIAPDVRELFARADGGSVGRVDVFSLAELVDVNAQRGYRKAFPSAVIFASDGGDKFFFIDATNALGRGAGAVMRMDRGAARADLLVLAAPDLETFLGFALRGEDPWLSRPTLGKSETDDMLAAVGAAAVVGKVAGTPYVVLSDALPDAVQRCRIQLPVPLSRLLREIFDGMRMDAAGIAIWPASRLEPVPDLPADNPRFPAMIWFAEDDTGERYAVVASEWRGVERHSVVQLSPNSDPQAAPVLGRFCAVVTAWVRS